jgi:hypothetical protein
MRLQTAVPLVVVCAARVVACLAQAPATLKIPPVKTSLNLEGQPVEITAWGTVSAAPSGIFRLAITIDLGNFQENLTPVLAAQLNRSDHCRDRLSVERAVLAPEAPSSLLTAYVHYERFACVKAFGKEVVKRLAGGDGAVEVNLTPSVRENRIALTAQTRKIDASGSLGELLNSGSLGDSIREKITAKIESAIQKSANLKSTMPPGIEDVAVIQTVQFADGGAGRLWLTITGDLHLSPEQFRDVAKSVAQ